MMKKFKMFENKTNKTNKDILEIQDEYNLLRIKLKKYLIFSPSYEFNEENCQLESFDIGKNVIYFYYSDYYYSDNSNGEVDLNDFILFYNDEDEYKKLFKIRKETGKYNI